MIEGFFLFYKPPGISSAGFLNKVKGHLSNKKIGHGGTLDPFASGLLVTGVGKNYTKKLGFILKNAQKEYLADIFLGAKSSTDDISGIITKVSFKKEIFKKDIEEAINKIQKEDYQIPPIFSAIKINGIPAYRIARSGNEKEIENLKKRLPEKKKKAILINYKILSFEKPNKDEIILKLKLKVSAGFYVRGFARDLGELLETGGYVKNLIRTKVGEFNLEEALKIDDLEDILELYFRAQGEVQNVGYRYFALETALKLGINGFSRNLRDSSIEIVGQGKLSVLERFLEIIKKGPKLAKINDFFACFRKVNKNFDGFYILK